MPGVLEIRFVNPDAGSGGFGNGLISGTNCINLDVTQYIHSVVVEFDNLSGTVHHKVYIPWNFVRYIRES